MKVFSKISSKNWFILAKSSLCLFQVGKYITMRNYVIKLCLVHRVYRPLFLFLFTSFKRITFIFKDQSKGFFYGHKFNALVCWIKSKNCPTIFFPSYSGKIMALGMEQACNRELFHQSYTGFTTTQYHRDNWFLRHRLWNNKCWFVITQSISVKQPGLFAIIRLIFQRCEQK